MWNKWCQKCQVGFRYFDLGVDGDNKIEIIWDEFIEPIEPCEEELNESEVRENERLH